MAHRLVRVRHDVDEHLVELVAVRPEHGQIFGEAERDPNVAGLELVRQQLHRLLHDVVELHFSALGRPPARQRQEVPHDADAASGGIVDLLRAPAHHGVARRVAEKLRVAGDHGQGVVELMGHARQERAHRRDLLALEEPLGALADGLLERAVLAVELEV